MTPERFRFIWFLGGAVVWLFVGEDGIGWVGWKGDARIC